MLAIRCLLPFYNKLTIRFLCIQVIPVIQPFDFGAPVNAMDMATVNCAVIKGEPTEIFWMFNKFTKLSSNDGVSIIKSGQRISMLNIESVRARHRGHYTCVVKYSAGFVEHTAELKVNGS